MACGFKAEDLRAALGDEVPGGPAITYIQEDEPLGTAGPVRLAADQGLLGDRFMVLNGDSLTDLDLTALQRQHEETGAVITLGLTRSTTRRRSGSSAAPSDGEVLGFLEKPEPGEIDTDEVSAGMYVIERQALDLIPAGRAVSIEREVFPRLVGQGLYGRRLEGYWVDIGTPERYLQASWDILEGVVETAVRPTADGLLIEEGASVVRGRRGRARARSSAAAARSATGADHRVRAARRLQGRRRRRDRGLDPRRRRHRRRRRRDRAPAP